MNFKTHALSSRLIPYLHEGSIHYLLKTPKRLIALNPPRHPSPASFFSQTSLL
jgi:hypothetical protein